MFLLVGIVGLLVVPIAPGSALDPAGAASASHLQFAAGNATNVTNISFNATPFQLSPLFWGSTVSPEAALLSTEASLFNATPNEAVVWPGANAGDRYDPLNNTLFDANGGPGARGITSEPQFVSWCESIHCTAILQVPGETDNISLAEAVVNYTEKSLGFFPAYWEIGNEPMLWRHWGVPWANWSTVSTNPPTPLQYGEEVANFSVAMRAAVAGTSNPTINIIGIPAAARPSKGNPYALSQWINGTIEGAGPDIQAVAFHEYPAKGSPNPQPHYPPTLRNFYNSLTSPFGLPQRVNQSRTAVTDAVSEYCPSSCASIPVFITELGTALSHRDYGTNYSGGFPGALATAAEIIQAITLNVTNVDLFASVFNTTNSWLTLQGAPRPVYFAYSEILSHLGSEAFPVQFPNYNQGPNQTLFGVATTSPQQGDRSDLLLVNTNATRNVTFLPQLPGYTPGAPVEMWWWNGTEGPIPGTAPLVTTAYADTPTPVGEYFPNGLPTTPLNLSAQSLVLVEAYPGPAVPVQVTEQGLPNGTTWFFTANGRTFDTNATNVTLFLPPGGLSVSSTTTYVTRSPYENSTFAKERIVPFVVAPTTVGSTPVRVTVYFTIQYKLNVTADPANGGVVLPSVGWANASAPLALTPVSAPGYEFRRWTSEPSDTLNGSYSGTTANITLYPNGSLEEMAHFGELFSVTFAQTGLGAGVPWSVVVRNITYDSSSNGTIWLQLPNGTYGFEVNPVPGFHAVPVNSSLTVDGTTVTVTVYFYHPPPTSFPVTFTETGLPAGIVWSVTIRGTPYYSATDGVISLSEPNGTYGFHVNPIAGYHPVPVNSSFTVVGEPVTVGITFYHNPPPSFPITFIQIGLSSGTPWSITVRSQVFASSDGGPIRFSEPNGTYGFHVDPVTGYHPVPVNSSFNVSGAAVTVRIAFYHPPPPSYSVTFFEQGLPANATWTVEVRGVNYSAIDAGPIALPPEINGTYGFHVSAVSEYHPVPVNSSFTVDGRPVTVQVKFYHAPPPSYPVSFVQTGLPTNLTWTVEVRGVNYSGAHGDPIALPPEINGTYGYHVFAVSMYHPVPVNSSFTVTGREVTVSIRFYHGPPTTFPVSFSEIGLPLGTTWAVVVRGVSYDGPAGGPIALPPEANGTYGYHVSPVAGYHSVPINSSFTVHGSSVSVTVTFYHPPLPTFPVTFHEVGLPGGTPWQVAVRATTYHSNASVLSIREVNGSYGLTVLPLAGYRATYPWSGFKVNGGPVDIQVTFAQRQSLWAVHFVETGLWSNENWSVTINGSTILAALSWVTVSLANGSYPFRVWGSGAIPHPSSGVVNVSGDDLILVDTEVSAAIPVSEVNISFAQVVVLPPSAWSLGFEAGGVGTVVGVAAWGTVVLLRRIRYGRRSTDLES